MTLALLSLIMDVVKERKRRKSLLTCSENFQLIHRKQLCAHNKMYNALRLTWCVVPYGVLENTVLSGESEHVVLGLYGLQNFDSSDV